MTGTHLYILTGASRGMGLAMTQQLLQHGNTLLCIARNVNPQLQAQANLVHCTLTQWPMDLSQTLEAATALKLWLARPSEDEDFVSATLINNAGMLPDIAPLSAVDPESVAQSLRVNLEAPMLLSAAFLEATADWRIPRKILNISSGLGRRPMASQAAYCAAKAGMDHFTRCMALEEAARPKGAKVCSLAPGVIATDMQVQLRGADPKAFPDRERFLALESSGQLSTPEDAAAQVLAWLARPDFGQEVVADVRG